VEIISYGGGVQTAALLVLNMNGEVSPAAATAVFSDTGSELAKTYEHVEMMARQYPIEIVRSELGPLHEFVIKEGKVPIPFRGDKGGMLYRRCTDRWKIQQVRRWLRDHGAEQATVQLGISTDEAHRMKDSPRKWITHRYPLIELGLSRADCMQVLRDEGLPIPPKSACFMCPFRKHSEWTRMKQEEPEEFEKAVDFEKHLEGLYIHPALQPLDKAVGDQYSFFEDDECGGYCWV